jgi:hypothetical protein
VFAFPLVLAVMAAVAAMCYAGHFGLVASDELLPWSFLYGICAVSLTSAMALSGFSCRRLYTYPRFMLWLVFWLGLSVFVLDLAVFGTAVAIAESIEPGFLAVVLIQMAIMTVVLGGILYLVNLPFTLLAFITSHYRNRFQKVLRLEHTGARLSRAKKRERYVRPASTAPTTQTVRVEDVLGQWQFYLDSLAKTVLIDFRPDGAFAQTILSNDGGRMECPGGTWRLDGPRIHLAGYVTAEQGASRSLTWWMIDAAAGPAVFGGDGDGPGSFFGMTRGSEPAAV